MPVEEVKGSIVFTDEAEVALRRTLNRLERRLRIRAVDEAVRARGVPAEVTSSDVNRASTEVSLPRRLPPGVWSERPPEFGDRLFEPGEGLDAWQIPRFTVDRLLTVYVLLGAVTALIGLIYPWVVEFLAKIQSDPLRRTGLLIAISGLMLALVSALLQRVLRKRRGKSSLGSR